MCNNEYKSLEQAVNDVETFQYSHETSTKHVLVQRVYVGSASPLIADIKTQPYSMLTYTNDGMMTGTYDSTHDIPIYIDNGLILNIMPTHVYDNAIGASKCKVMTVLDLRDEYHTLPLAEESQKYCGLTPYYGSPTYVYLRMGMGMSCIPALWQQFVHIIWEQLPNKECCNIILDDILIFSTKEQHWEDLTNLFEVLICFRLKISPHKCQQFRDKLVYMGLEFLIKDGTAHYTAMRDKCDAIHNMKAPQSVKECHTFCGMVNFLSTFCKNLRPLLIPIYELTKKHARFVWTDKHQKAFEEIKQLLVKPPVLGMFSGNRFFRLESDTSRTAARATLYQWQNNEWVLVGYHSKRLTDAVRNYRVTELELTGLLANIHGFEQKLNNNYFDYLIKSKHEPTSTKLVTLLDRLNRYTFDLKYLEGSKLKVSDTLSHLYSEEKHKFQM